MGLVLSKLRDEVEKASGEKKMEEDALETLRALETMANDKITAFYEKIENSAHDAKLIPINKVLTKYTFVRATTSKEEKIGPTIKKCVNTFSQGPVGDAIADLAENVFTMLLGASQGQRTCEERYAIRLNDLLGVSRLDVLFFAYNFQSKSIQDKCSSVLACCVVESSADVKDVDDNTLRVLLGNAYANSPQKTRSLIWNEMWWEILRKKDKTSLTDDEKQERKEHKAALKEYWAENDAKPRARELPPAA